MMNLVKPMTKSSSDDPRRLRALVSRAAEMAQRHSLTSVMVGLTAPVGDLLFPDFIEYLKSALRMEDGIFRMTRERTVVYLADVDASLAEQVMDRLIGEFETEYPTFCDASPQRRYFEIAPPAAEASVKEVLTAIFAPPTYH